MKGLIKIIQCSYNTWDWLWNQIYFLFKAMAILEYRSPATSRWSELKPSSVLHSFKKITNLLQIYIKKKINLHKYINFGAYKWKQTQVENDLKLLFRSI
jgi:hypothetical protein